MQESLLESMFETKLCEQVVVKSELCDLAQALGHVWEAASQTGMMRCTSCDVSAGRSVSVIILRRVSSMFNMVCLKRGNVLD